MHLALAVKELAVAVRELADRPEAGFSDLHLRRAEVAVARALASSMRWPRLAEGEHRTDEDE